jgi:hypothetical protein
MANQEATHRNHSSNKRAPLRMNCSRYFDREIRYRTRSSPYLVSKRAKSSFVFMREIQQALANGRRHIHNGFAHHSDSR